MNDIIINAYCFGHPIKWVPEELRWVYLDEKPNTTEVYQNLICPRCKLKPTIDGHDPCIKNLPNVKYACCGHGIDDKGLEPAYIYFTNGKLVRFKTTDEILQYIETNKIQWENEKPL